MASRGSQGEEVDWGAGAGSGDAEGTVDVLNLGGADARAREGSDEGNKREQSRNLHFERV